MDTASKLQLSGRYCAIATALTGTAVLVGWTLGIEPVKRILPDLVAMNPASAVCFILSGLSFFLLTDKVNSKARRMTGYTLASIVFFASVIKMAGVLTEKDVFIDSLLFSDQLIEPNHPNRMAPNTSISFLLLSLSLMLINILGSNDKLPSQYISITLAVFSLLSVLGYLYRIKFFYGIYSYIPMALHTAICFLMMSYAILFAHPRRGVIGELTRTKSGATAAGFLIPSAILIPMILGFFRLYSEWKGYLELEVGTSFLILSIILLLLIMIWFTIKTLNHREDLRRKAEESLSSVNQELSSFTYSVSHDLRAPLRAMNGYASILLKDHSAALNEEAKQYLESIRSNALKMGNLVDDLLKFSHLGKKEVEQQEINMTTLTNEVVDQLKRTVKHQAKISVGKLHSITGDSGLIRQVMQNLISNAIKYSARKEKPEIEISSEAKNNEIIFKIKDNGAGFDMQYKDKLFGVFQRLHNQDEFEGTGVGLAIVHRIITKHGGKVWAESKPDHGATFYFSLPKKQSANTYLSV
jgi:signal transduction histidine kinase